MKDMAFDLAIITDKKRRVVWKRAFHLWQRRPFEVAQMAEEERRCNSCGTVFQGNFCPRCGQAARVGRFSFKTALLLFIDVWGIGNRGMFRSIRDLLLRPGYMIRDYLIGCQSAYFPPFKMFFLLTTFSLLLSHGVNLIQEEENPKENATEMLKVDDQTESIEIGGKEVRTETVKKAMKVPQLIGSLHEKYPALFGILILVLFSAPLYVFFRHCPNIPDLRYSEHLVALVYVSNMYTIYTMLSEGFKLLSLQFLSSVASIMGVVMVFVALKQYSGFSKRRLLGYILLSVPMTIVPVVVLFLIACLTYALFT